jgi:hypothetical protein
MSYYCLFRSIFHMWKFFWAWLIVLRIGISISTHFAANSIIISFFIA